jgi:hypothetical protein
LAARAPGLDIFSQLFVLRDSAGWQITELGRAFLVSVEAPVSDRPLNPLPFRPAKFDMLALIDRAAITRAVRFASPQTVAARAADLPSRSFYI